MKSQHSFYMEDELYKQLRIHAIERGQSASDFIADVITAALPAQNGHTPPWTEPVSEPEPAPAPRVIHTPAEATAAVALLDRPIHPVPKPTPQKRRSRRS